MEGQGGWGYVEDSVEPVRELEVIQVGGWVGGWAGERGSRRRESEALSLKVGFLSAVPAS